jgi:hypothetical protein
VEWWERHGIDPLPIAGEFWMRTRHEVVQPTSSGA